MNWLKAMLLMVVLGAILYGVNLVLNKSAPVESPMPNGAWSGMDGPIAPPSVAPGTAGTNAPAGNAPPSYGQAPPRPPPTVRTTIQQIRRRVTLRPTAIHRVPPPASASVYGSSATPTTAAAAPSGSSNNTAMPPAAATSNYTAGGYGSAAPPAAASEQSHSTIPATPVGLTTTNANSSSPTAGNTAGAAAFASAMELVMATLREGHLAEGLQRLTLLYDDPQLNARRNQATERPAGPPGRHRRLFPAALACFRPTKSSRAIASKRSPTNIKFPRPCWRRSTASAIPII